jgi:phosphocarrier protein HPr
MDNRVSRTVVVQNQLGIHTRPSMQIVDTANRFESIIVFEREGDDLELLNGKYDGKSVMEVTIMAAAPGSTLHIHAEGPDATEALDALVALFKAGFGEE